MGLNLKRSDFADWVESIIERKERNSFIEQLEQHIGEYIEADRWTLTDDTYPKVGSYTAYGVFWYCLYFLTEGDFENELEPDEDIELEALQSFRSYLKPASLELPYVDHFLDVDPGGSIFIPVLFDSPFEFNGVYVASRTAAEQVLEVFANALGFDLYSPYEEEMVDDTWLPLSTAKNVARTIYQFFREKPEACVEFA